MEEMIAHERQ